MGDELSLIHILDLGVLDNTLSLVAEYYIKDTKDILLSYPIPSTVGKNAPTVNAGKVRNTGFEMELRYNNKFGDLSLNTSLIYGYNHNEVRGLIQEMCIRDSCCGNRHRRKPVHLNGLS